MRILFHADNVAKTGDMHILQKEIFNYPPEGVEYIRTKYKKTLFERAHARFFPLKPIRTLPEKSGFDLIHTDNFLLRNNAPWIQTTETLHTNYKFYANAIKKIYLSDFCRKVLPYSDAAKAEILAAIPELKDKIETMHLAIHAPEFKKIKHDGINILFVGIDFYRKGGKEVTEAFEILKKKYDNINLVTASSIPHEKMLSEVYPSSDIFVMPSYQENFGFAHLEAMSFGLPVIVTNIFAFPEVVHEGKNGFLINAKYVPPSSPTDYFKQDKPEVVQQLVEKLSLLIESKRLRTKMGLTGRKMVENGKLSIGFRNKKLKRIYEEAIK